MTQFLNVNDSRRYTLEQHIRTANGQPDYVFISYSATVFMKMDTFCAEFYYMSLSCIKSGFAQVSFKDHAPVCGTMYSAWVMLRLADSKEQCQDQKNN